MKQVLQGVEGLDGFPSGHLELEDPQTHPTMRIQEDHFRRPQKCVLDPPGGRAIYRDLSITKLCPSWQIHPPAHYEFLAYFPTVNLP